MLVPVCLLLFHMMGGHGFTLGIRHEGGMGPLQESEFEFAMFRVLHPECMLLMGKVDINCQWVWIIHCQYYCTLWKHATPYGTVGHRL